MANTSDEQEKLRILITDDSRLLRKKLHEELERLGCEVVEAVNGKEAITLVLEQEPDGIFLDIVMLSSMGTPQKLMQCLKMGAIDFIHKPYTKEQIIQTIAAFRKAKAKRVDKGNAEQYNDF